MILLKDGTNFNLFEIALNSLYEFCVLTTCVVCIGQGGESDTRDSTEKSLKRLNYTKIKLKIDAV